MNRCSTKSLSSTSLASRAVMPITPLPPRFLSAIGADQRAFDEAVVRERDDDTFVGDQILNGDLSFRRHDLGAAFGSVLLLDFAQASDLMIFSTRASLAMMSRRSLIVSSKASYSS